MRVRSRYLILPFVALQTSAVPFRLAERVDRVGNLSTARAVHTATTLPDGDVLIAGGMAQGGGSLASTELIDGRTKEIRPGPDMTEHRAGHTATRLADGRVVIAGGYDGSYIASIEIYDPAQRRFEAVGRLVEERSGHTATLLQDGRILFVGGVGRGWTFLASAELFDPETGTSMRTGSMSVARESHTATRLADGRVLITGGHRGRRADMEVFASAEAFDPATLRFERAGTMSTARHKHDAVRLADGRVLVLGGADRTDRRYFASTEIYDVESRTFSPGPTLRQPRYKIEGTTIRLANGDILVAGGSRTVERLDAGSLRFVVVPGILDDDYAFAAATLLPNGDVLIAGGYDARNRNSSGVWTYRVD